MQDKRSCIDGVALHAYKATNSGTAEALDVCLHVGIGFGRPASYNRIFLRPAARAA